MTRIFRSAVFWVLVTGFLLGLALFFLLPLLGVKAGMPRLLGSLAPPVLAGIVALLISIFRLKRALKSQDATQTNPFESGLAVKPWLDPLKRETKEALEILKQSGRGKVRVGQNPLEVFRFYLVLGNSGAGKSSLLEHSGIHFPRRFPTAADLAKQTFHFTQWWFSNQGIFLETPARYATGEEGDEEFQVWLSLLEREGKRIALDGVLLTVSLRELLDAGAGAQELASRYREKLALAMSTLRLELPIYLVFTHADLLPGFREFFENLQEPENHQVLGATFALRGNLAPARQRFEREYRKIWDSLQARTPMRLAQLAEPRRRKPIFLFPNEFGAAQERLALFVEHLFKDSMRRERALFRGFFLTSVSPSEATDLVRGGADPFAETGAHFLDHKAKMRGPAASPRPEAPGRSRSLFTYLLFGGVLKSDKSLAQIPGYRLGNMSRRALIASGTMAVAAVGLCLYSLWGYLESRSHLGKLSNTITEAAQLRWRDPLDFRAEYASMDRLLGAIRALDAGEAGSVPPGFRHSGEALDLAARAHGRQINRMAATGALRNLAATLEMGAKFYNPAEHGRLHDNLRLYLLLTPEGRKHFQDVKPEDFASWLGPLWTQEVVHRVGPENLPSNLETGLDDHAAYYARRYLDEKLPTLDRGDAGLIAATRQALLGTPSIEGLYASIVGAEDPARDLTLAEMGVPGDAALKSSSKVRGFYTKAAFDDNAMDRLAEGAEQPHRRDWVLGEGAATVLPPEMQDQRQLYRALIDRYYQDYADEWMHFLQSLSVRLPGEPGLASGKLSGFGSTTQGLPAVLGRLSVEVNLLAPPGAGEKAAEGALKKKLGKASGLVGMATEARDADKKKLKEKFKFVEELNGTPGASGPGGAGLLQDYFTALKGLSEMMGKLALGGEGATDAMDAAIQLFSGKADSPLNACWNEANKVRTRYETQTWLTPLLENPVRDVAGYLAGTAGTQLESVYKTKVLAFYNQNLRGRYPLAKAGTQEVNLEDMKSFFNPDNGIFTAFVNGKLMPFLKPEDDGYSARHWNGIRLKLQPAALQGISRGMAVSRRMYTDMPYTLRVYNLNITLQEAKNTARVLFRLGEERIAVKPGEGQARLTFRWPNENSYKGAEILVESVNGGSQNRRVDGSWGFLKLLDGARALNVRTGGLTAKWRFNVAQKYDVDVALEGNIPERENPFTFPDYYKFELPAGLTADGDGRLSSN